MTGTIKHIYDLQQVSDKFKKQDIAITLDGDTKYPQHVLFQVTQDKCQSLVPLNVGDNVNFEYNLKGREWNGAKGIQYFNALEIWTIKKA